tara:strand:- start:267 stop:470 length:204 start_codon:yes stop_codon:yes gene_type:complete
MKELYAVYYNFEGRNYEPRELECITDDFDKWFEEHNKNRIADGGEPEDTDEFDVEEISPIIYNKEEK